MGVLETSDHIQIKIKMLNSSQENPVSSKVQNEDLKNMDILCTFKIKAESQNFDHWCIRPATISKSRSRNQTPVRNLQHSPKL